MYDYIAQILEMMLESIAAPGNLTRNLVATGSEPWATLGISAVFLMTIPVLAGAEYQLRKATGRTSVLIPDEIFVARPDSGFSTWTILLFWAVMQGPLSAIV